MNSNNNKPVHSNSVQSRNKNHQIILTLPIGKNPNDLIIFVKNDNWEFVGFFTSTEFYNKIIHDDNHLNLFSTFPHNGITEKQFNILKRGHYCYRTKKCSYPTICNSVAASYIIEELKLLKTLSSNQNGHNNIYITYVHIETFLLSQMPDILYYSISKNEVVSYRYTSLKEFINIE